MDYIKQNKIFILLVTILSVKIAYLLIQLYPHESNQSSTVDKQEVVIESFNGKFDVEHKSVNLSWHVTNGDNSLKKIEIVKDEEVLCDVSEQNSISLGLVKYDLLTGKNVFTLQATTKSGNVKTKDVELYIDEAFDFSVVESVKENSVLYTLSYYYDSRKSVSVPEAVVSSSEPFGIVFKDSKTVDTDGNLVKKESTYELRFNDVKAGTYNITIEFNCVAYGIKYTYDKQIQVNGGNTDE